MQRVNNKADQDKKIFVGGLHRSTSENELKNYYGKFGEITDVVIMKDRTTGISRGFGFVTFQTSASVDAAQDSRPHTLSGKQIDSKRAMPREDTTSDVHAAVKKIFVGALRRDIDNISLRDFFSNFGNVVDAQVVMSKETNESRGFGFVTFDDTDAVDKVILARPLAINDSKIDVRKALNKDEMGKNRTRQAPTELRQNWGNGNSGNANKPYNNSYSQPYGNQSASYDNGSYGYNYVNPVQPSWTSQPVAVENGFGSYSQQAFGGGPLRHDTVPNVRQVPYNGQPLWQSR